ncbi:MAG: glycosyltransferase family 4 protein [Chitinophagales bacterium]|nr:glycosyltransferase family 4 protein [Chitinophagales bacterium]MCO5279577.1 glycosyltransferase family 4 protein [Chitinophagales bacterium]OJV24202.1 MAG: hypothetical protein BGO32_04130 [Bacteroidetes bacterium 37-13]
MRIAFDAKRAFNNFSGLGNYSRLLISALEENFPENDYFLFTPKVQYPLLENFPKVGKIILPETTYQKLFSFYWRSWALQKQLSENRIDIFHGLSNELPFNAHRFKCKNVVTIHDLLYLKHPEDFPAFDRFFYQQKTAYAVKTADIITVNSQQTKQDLISYFKISEKKIDVTPHAIGNHFYTAKSKEEREKVLKKYQLPKKFVLQPGSFLGRKNHALSIAAFSSISKKYSDLNLVFTGSGGNLENKLRTQIEHSGLSSKIIIRKNIEAFDMPTVYQASEMVLYPSLNEGFGLPILEAFASNVPVITSNINVFKETGGSAALYINPKLVSELENAISLLIEDNVQRQLLIKEGELQLSKFSSKAIAERMMQLYRSL